MKANGENVMYVVCFWLTVAELKRVKEKQRKHEYERKKSVRNVKVDSEDIALIAKK